MTARTAAVARATTLTKSLLPTDDAHSAVDALLEPHSLRLGCGGAAVGGSEASQLLSSSFASLHPSVLDLTGDYRSAQRAVLFRRGEPVAAAVARYAHMVA